jgi:hypothetical protein
MHISDDVKGTSPDRLTGTDVMAAIGTTSSRALRSGGFFGKGNQQNDEQLAVQALARYAMESAPKNVRKAAGGEFGWCMQMLAQFAFAEYSRSAETSVTCHSCSGSGLTSQYEDVIKHPESSTLTVWKSYRRKSSTNWSSVHARHVTVKVSCWPDAVAAVKVRCSTAKPQASAARGV